MCAFVERREIHRKGFPGNIIQFDISPALDDRNHTRSQRRNRAHAVSNTWRLRLFFNIKNKVNSTADIQDRDGGGDVIAQAREEYPTLELVYAGGGYSGDKLKPAVEALNGPVIEIVKRPNEANGFVVIARRWVERTFAWLGRCRRLSRDWETTIASAEAWILLASIRRMTPYIARETSPQF